MENKEMNSAIESESNVKNAYVSSELVDLGIQENIPDDQTNTTADTFGVQPVMKWNWGAFVLPFWWCLFSYCYWQLLLSLPYINIIGRFIVAAKGNEWSWKTGKWKDAEYFNKTQKTWNKAGIIFLIIIILLPMVVFVISDLFRVRY